MPSLCSLLRGSLSSLNRLLVAPPIIEENGNRTALLGENVFLQCLAFSTVPIKIKWYRGNKEILTDRRFVVTTDLQVAISNARVEDSGWYSCVASNGGGQSINSFYLKVYGKYARHF